MKAKKRGKAREWWIVINCHGFIIRARDTLKEALSSKEFMQEFAQPCDAPFEAIKVREVIKRGKRR